MGSMIAYGLDPERFAKLDAELARAEDYFTRVRDELREKASPLGKDTGTVRNAEMVMEAIKRLRFELRQEQERRTPHRRPH